MMPCLFHLAQIALPLAQAIPEGSSWRGFAEVSIFLISIGFNIFLAINAIRKNRPIPQPLETVEVEGPVNRGSYLTHCRINREEHARIERELRTEIKELSSLHHELAREVSGVIKTLEQNGLRLVQMDTKLDQILIRQTAVVAPRKV